MSETVRWHSRYACMTYVRSWSRTPGYLTLYIFMYANNTSNIFYFFPNKIICFMTEGHINSFSDKKWECCGRAGSTWLPCARFAFTMQQPMWHEQSKWVIWLMIMKGYEEQRKLSSGGNWWQNDKTVWIMAVTIWITSLTIHLSSRTLGKTVLTTAESRREMIFHCKEQ